MSIIFNSMLANMSSVISTGVTIASSNSGQIASSVTFNPTPPSGLVSGNLVVVVFIQSAARATSNANGWTEITGAANLNSKAFWIIATGSTLPDITMASTATTRGYSIARITGHNATPIDQSVWSTAGSGTTLTASSVTTTVADSLGLIMAVANGTSNTLNSITNGFSIKTTQTVTFHSSISSKALPSIGATGSSLLTWNVSSTLHDALTINIKPA